MNDEREEEYVTALKMCVEDLEMGGVGMLSSAQYGRKLIERFRLEQGSTAADRGK